jgi:hypothetical protein
MLVVRDTQHHAAQHADGRPLAVRTDRRPLTVTTDRRPLTVTTDRRPLTVRTDRRPLAVTSDNGQIRLRPRAVMPPDMTGGIPRSKRSTESRSAGGTRTSLSLRSA